MHATVLYGTVHSKSTHCVYVCRHTQFSLSLCLSSYFRLFLLQPACLMLSTCRTNFGPYFSFLDGIMGTKSGKHDRPCTPLLLAASLLYMVAFFGGLQLLLTHPLHTVLVYLVAYVATPPALSAAVFDALRVPQAVRWAAGSVIDAYRRHCGVEYAEPGQLGSFVTDSQQAASSSRTRSTHAASPTYIFACHPTGEAEPLI